MKSKDKTFSIEFAELYRGPGKVETVVSYGLKLKGANPRSKYILSVMVIGAMESPLQVERFAYVNGRWMGERQEKVFEEYQLGATGFQKGLRLTATLKEVGGHQEASVSIIPFPLERRDGPCLIGLELLNGEGTLFSLYGEGFVPGEKVNFKSVSGKEVIGGTYLIDNNGTIPPSVLMPGNEAFDYSSRIEVRGSRCAPGFDYQWGPPAMIKQ